MDEGEAKEVKTRRARTRNKDLTWTVSRRTQRRGDGDRGEERGRRRRGMHRGRGVAEDVARVRPRRGEMTWRWGRGEEVTWRCRGGAAKAWTREVPRWRPRQGKDEEEEPTRT